MQDTRDATSPRLAELIGALSLATDIGAGLGMETALRTCWLAVELGRSIGVKGEELRDVYYTALLRFIGCTAYAHETAALYGGDDLSILHAFAPADQRFLGCIAGTTNIPQFLSEENVGRLMAAAAAV